MKIVNDREQFLNSLDLKDKYCAEIGVFRGDFSKMILKKDPIYLYLVDPFAVSERTYGTIEDLPVSYSTDWDYLYVKQRFKFDHRVIIKRDYSYDLVKTIQDNYFDFIYIDACHLYEDVKQDLNQWLPKLKTGGIMAGHDYIENYKDHVGKAVREFCKENNFEMFLFNEQGGDWALRII
jgi:hypothetical protein